MESFQECARKHLASYKRERLGVKADGIWRKNGQAYPHILPKELRYLNLLETYRAEFRQYRRANGLKLHRDFHHLNSSQALCFNLFFPFFGMGSDRSDLLLEALGIEPEPVSRCVFEHIEDEAEQTNFDLFLAFQSGRRLFIELKFTEAGFGACKDDAKHNRKLTNIYAPKLAHRVSAAALVPRTFFANYQLLRNITYADAATQATTLLLLPRGNEAFGTVQDQLCELLGDPVPQEVRVTYLEDVLNTLQLRAADLSHREACHVELLAEKYLIPEQGGA